MYQTIYTPHRLTVHLRLNIYSHEPISISLYMDLQDVTQIMILKL